MQLKCSAPTGEPNRPPEGAAGAEIPLQIPVCPDGKDFHGAEGIHGEHPCCPGENNEHRKGTAAAKRAGGGIFILIALFSLLAMNAEFGTFVYQAWLAGHCCLCKLSEGDICPGGMLPGFCKSESPAVQIGAVQI